MKVKRIIYETSLSFRRFLWKLRGGRRIKAFDQRFWVTPNTIFPTYRKFPLPKGDCLSEIVRYTDFVQLHSVCKLVTKLKRPTIVEIGAHHGAYAIIMGKIIQKKAGKIIAVEPNPESYGMMVRNVLLNGLEDTIICEKVAIMDKVGRMRMVLDGVQSRITSDQSNSGIPMEVSTLQRLFEKYRIGYVDLLLIDVEGAELSVLNSFPWQSIRVGKIYCELHPYAWENFGYNGEDMRHFLLEHQYRVIDMYLQEHKSFGDETYIGPTEFLLASNT
jgi:FkbM family methyltransferase